MGTVIAFPRERRAAGGRADEIPDGAMIIILPVVRVERGDDPSDGRAPDSSSAPGRKRRRRSSRP